ncbi:unnamed protein product [Linum trigynum]|uniref:Uncharacterized protein n=1 Tax=Linum trigynum TaxID=586398 RepID=A0AAV2DB29_9ROSI
MISQLQSPYTMVVVLRKMGQFYISAAHKFSEGAQLDSMPRPRNRARTIIHVEFYSNSSQPLNSEDESWLSVYMSVCRHGIPERKSKLTFVGIDVLGNGMNIASFWKYSMRRDGGGSSETIHYSPSWVKPPIMHKCMIEHHVIG